MLGRGALIPLVVELKVLYLAFRNLEEFRRPNTEIRSSRVETGAPAVDHLFRRAMDHRVLTGTRTGRRHRERQARSRPGLVP